MKNRTSRSPLLATIRELIKTSSQPDAKRLSRREFLKQTAGTTAIIAASPLLTRISFAKDAPKVVIIGGGIAGLNAAYKLRKAGIIAQIYEASNRIGGRIFTVRNFLAQGLTTEFGGEFIDSNHSDIIALADEFELERRNRRDTTLIRRAYYFGGKLRAENDVINELKPYLDIIRTDFASLPKYFDYEHPGNAGDLDKLSLAEYFHRLKISGWIKDLLEAAYVTEYGLETSEQSALNFITMIGSDISKEFEIFGSSDEKYVIHGGNARIIEGLSDKLPDQINLFHKLRQIKSKGKGFTLKFDAYNDTKSIDADIVLLAIPFSILRDIEMKTELPKWKKKAIQELGYGHHTKILSGFTKRIWQDAGYAGEVFCDENFQLAWDNSQTQDKTSGGMTSFAGGKYAEITPQGTIAEQSQKFINELDKIFPGIAKTSNGKNSRFDWTNYEFTKGSYSCYKPGQWTSIRGAERKSIGNLFFAGEHCSLDFQGFMNGGAETGKKAAEEIIALAK